MEKGDRFIKPVSEGIVKPSAEGLVVDDYRLPEGTITNDTLKAREHWQEKPEHISNPSIDDIYEMGLWARTYLNIRNVPLDYYEQQFVIASNLELTYLYHQLHDMFAEEELGRDRFSHMRATVEALLTHEEISDTFQRNVGFEVIEGGQGETKTLEHSNIETPPVVPEHQVSSEHARHMIDYFVAHEGIQEKDIPESTSNTVTAGWTPGGAYQKLYAHIQGDSHANRNGILDLLAKVKEAITEAKQDTD